MSNFPDFPLAINGQKRKGLPTPERQSSLGAANAGTKKGGTRLTKGGK